MNVRVIRYHPDFIADLKKLDPSIQQRAIKTEFLFRSNPLHPSIRLHPLKGKLAGKWTLSVTMKIRIIFLRLEKGEIVFLSIGQHDIYRSF
jgi:addiction module RelE/StbE family toxin